MIPILIFIILILILFRPKCVTKSYLPDSFQSNLVHNVDVSESYNIFNLSRRPLSKADKIRISKFNPTSLNLYRNVYNDDQKIFNDTMKRYDQMYLQDLKHRNNQHI